MTNLINLDTPFFDNNTGEPLALGKAYFGEPNTDPKTNTKAPYTSLNPNVATTATQTLTAAGKLQNRLYLDGDYSLTVDDSEGNQILNYDSIAQDESSAWVLFSGTPTQTSATTFTVTGDQTATFTVGARVKLDDASTLYGIVTSAVYTSLTTVTVVTDSGSLTGSLSAVYTGISTTTGKEISTATISHLNQNTSVSIVYTLEQLLADLPLSIKLMGAFLDDASAGARATNDTAIQSALDFCYNNGLTVQGEVYIPGGGIYYTSTTLNHKGTVCISGAGIYTSTISSSAAACMQADTTAGASDYKMQKLTLIGAGRGYDTNGKGITRAIYEFCILDGGNDGYGYYGEGKLINCVWRDCIFSHIFKVFNTGAMNNNKFENCYFNRNGTVPSVENGEVLVIVASGSSSVLIFDTCVVEVGSMRIDATVGTWSCVDLSGMWIGDGPSSPRSAVRLNTLGQSSLRNLSMDTHILDLSGCNDISYENIRAYAVDTGDGYGGTDRLFGKGLITSDDTKIAETSGGTSEIVHEGTLYGTGLPVTRCMSLHFLADAAALDTWTRYIFANSRSAKIRRVVFIPEATITAAGSNFAQLTVKTAGGGSTVDIADFSIESVSAGALYSFDVSGTSLMTANTTVLIEKTVFGTGMAMPAMTVVFEYEDRGWA